MSIGQKIKDRRMELGWSQRELSEKMGYNNHSTITRIESGKVDVPQSRIMKFSEVLGVSIAYLMGWEEVEKKNDIAVDIAVRLRKDDEFLSIVSLLNDFDSEKLQKAKQILQLLL